MLGYYGLKYSLGESGRRERNIMNMGRGRFLVLQDMIPAKLSGRNEFIYI
jgi:hypothetical protein